MKKNKIYIFILLLAVVLSSCSEYQKVLNKGKAEDQYILATKLYEQQKFNKALSLFEKIVPSFRGKPQMERIQYMMSQSYFNTKQYSLSSYYFDKFTKNYPQSSKVEESAFLSAKSYYYISPVYSLDQKDTYEAINALQNYIYKYPNSSQTKEANEIIKELNYKLEKKAFEVAKQYYRTEDYIAAITAFDNFLSEYLGTSFKEKALYLRFLSSYELAINSFYLRKEDRLNQAIKLHQKFKRSFPESEKLEETEELLEEINQQLEQFIAQKTTENGL